MRMIAPCCVVLALLASCQTPTPREPQPSVVLKPYAPLRPEPPLTPQQIRDKHLRQMQDEIREQIEKTQSVIDSTRQAPPK